MNQLQTPQQFLNDFVTEVSKADQNVFIQTMNFESGEVMNQFGEVLKSAAQRKIAIYIKYDWVADKFIHSTLPVLPILNRKRRIDISTLRAENKNMTKQFEKAGIKIEMTNKPIYFPFIPFMGRNHIKMYIVDNKIAWIGGINLFDEAFENIDFMIKITNKDFVTVLERIFTSNKRSQNYFLDCGRDYKVYLDVGKKMRSIIYNNARILIRESKKSIVFMSQFVPDSYILQELINAAKRDVKVIILTSPKQTKVFSRFPQKLAYNYFRLRIKDYENISFIHMDKFVHSKLLFVDENVAFFGSHNLTYFGVLLGTEELMIETRDTNLMEDFRNYISEHLKDYAGEYNRYV